MGTSSSSPSSSASSMVSSAVCVGDMAMIDAIDHDKAWIARVIVSITSSVHMQSIPYLSFIMTHMIEEARVPLPSS